MRARLAGCDLRRWSKEPGLIALPLLCIAVFSALVYLRAGGHLQNLTLALYDMFLGLRPAAAHPDPRITLVRVTESDIRELGEWPLSDRTLARILDALGASQPAVVGLDIYRDRPVPPGSDALQARLQRRSDVVMINKFGADGSLAVAAPAVMEAAGRAGFSDVTLDPDGVVRRGLLYLDAEQVTASSFALKLALGYLDRKGIVPQPGESDPTHIRLGKATLPPLEEGDGPYTRIDASGYQLLLDYRGGESPFRLLSLAEVLDGRAPANAFRNRIVIVGVAAESVKDSFFTPFSGGMHPSPGVPGIVIHAQTASQLLRSALDGDRPLRTLDQRAQVGWILVWCVAGTIVALVTRSASRFLMFVPGGLALLLLIGFAAFVSGWWVPAVTPGLGWLASASLGTAYLSGHERKQRKLLMHLFETHVSSHVAGELWLHRDAFLRGGRLVPREMPVTVMFTDIESFTAISEALSPDELLRWLNTYMGAMASIIMEHGGVIDDYYGDAIKANFGVPIARAQKEEIRRDALDALQCARHMERELMAINAHCERGGIPGIRIRVGICTGNVVAGCVGSAQRMKYTTVGDTVNIAARLESFGKDDIRGPATEGNCRVLMAESTWRLVNDVITAEKVGDLPLKGKRETVTVFRVATRPGKGNHES